MCFGREIISVFRAKCKSKGGIILPSHRRACPVLAILAKMYGLHSASSHSSMCRCVSFGPTVNAKKKSNPFGAIKGGWLSALAITSTKSPVSFVHLIIACTFSKMKISYDFPIVAGATRHSQSDNLFHTCFSFLFHLFAFCHIRNQQPCTHTSQVSGDRTPLTTRAHTFAGVPILPPERHECGDGVLERPPFAMDHTCAQTRQTRTI